MTDADPSERGIGMVFQSYALYPTMTVRDNMSFGLRMAGTPKAEIARRVERAAGMLQLDAMLSRKPAQLSGGQRQRVAIGRALVRETGVFLFDEPLSNLDAKLRAELRRELKLLHARLGSTMIYVTHDQVEAMTLASRIVVMQGGAVQQIGTPAEVYERPANRFVAGFLGAPAMNFIEGKIGPHQRFNAGAFGLDLSGAGAPGAAVLGLRPEHVHIDPAGPLSGKVTLVEPMGSHQVVWIECGGHLLSSVMQGAQALAPGQPVRFAVDTACVSLFDPASGERLAAPAMQYATV
jgi:multiple sugar transport system ATP-binding protein